VRRTLSQAALLLLLALGAEGELAAATGPMEAAEREERNSHLRFMPGEVISRELGSEGRSGIIDGIPYVYSIDGQGRPATGRVAGWFVRTIFDEMDDTETYYLVNDAARLMVFPGTNGSQPRFCVIGHDFPQRHAMARVDSEPVVNALGDGCFSSTRLFLELSGGAVVRTRRYEWPYDYSQDAVGDAAHFGKAVRLLAYMRKTRFE